MLMQLKQLIIVLIGLGLILRFLTRQQALRKLGMVLLTTAFFPFIVSFGQNFYYQLTPIQKVGLIAFLLPLTVFIILRILLGKDLFNNIAGNFIYDGLKAVMIFPFRIITRLIRRLNH